MLITVISLCGSSLQHVTWRRLHRQGCLGLNDTLLGCLCLLTVRANNARFRATGAFVSVIFSASTASGGGRYHSTTLHNSTPPLAALYSRQQPSTTFSTVHTALLAPGLLLNWGWGTPTTSTLHKPYESPTGPSLNPLQLSAAPSSPNPCRPSQLLSQLSCTDPQALKEGFACGVPDRKGQNRTKHPLKGRRPIVCICPRTLCRSNTEARLLSASLHLVSNQNWAPGLMVFSGNVAGVRPAAGERA